MTRHIAVIMLLLPLALITHCSHLALLQQHAVAPPRYGASVDAMGGAGTSPDEAADAAAANLPSASSLAWLSLGYRHLVADYFWLRSVAYYGDKREAGRHWPNLVPLLARAQALDPKFVAPYIFAGHVLTLRDMPWRRALEMLQRGAQERPDAWDVAFLYGFVLYFMAEDFHGAARVMAQAAQVRGAPPFLALLASRLAGEAGDPEVGLRMMDALLAQGPKPDEAVQLQGRRRRLIVDVDLRALNRASRAYRAARGRAPTSLDELVGRHGLERIPPDPFGGSYALNVDGTVTSRHATGRLRFAASATRPGAVNEDAGQKHDRDPRPPGSSRAAAGTQAGEADGDCPSD